MELSIDLIKSFLINELDPDLIYIFGSYAKNRVRENSDIDIAFLSDRYFNEYETFLTAQELADKLKCEVDLIDLKKASTVLKVQVIQGQLIYNRDNNKKMLFEMQAFRDYAKLNEERKEVLQTIQRSLEKDDNHEF